MILGFGVDFYLFSGGGVWSVALQRDKPKAVQQRKKLAPRCVRLQLGQGCGRSEATLGAKWEDSPSSVAGHLTHSFTPRDTELATLDG